jgi:hypothetical protein
VKFTQRAQETAILRNPKRDAREWPQGIGIRQYLECPSDDITTIVNLEPVSQPNKSVVCTYNLRRMIHNFLLVDGCNFNGPVEMIPTRLEEVTIFERLLSVHSKTTHVKTFDNKLE